MSGGPPFDRYPASPGQVRGAADATRNRIGRVQDIATDVEREHRSSVDLVQGELLDSMRNAPSGAIRTASHVHQRAEFAAGCLEWFALAIDEFNVGRTAYPRSVSELNAAWDTAVRVDSLERRDPDLSIEDGQLDRTASDLRTEYAATEERLDDDAAEVTAMLERGPNTDDVQTLWRAGVLPPYAVLVYPDAGLQHISLPPDAQRDLVDYLVEHPDLLVDLPPALAAVVEGLPRELRTDVYVEQRMEHLRREGLLTGDNPGGLYEEWIQNTVENDVSLNAVIDIARDHDIRPASFDVLNGLREITDDDGKSYFVLDSDMSGDEARDATLMTYILNAGTDYGSGDFAPTPYNSDEVQRIIDRQHGNSWSYDEDVGFVHGNGGTLVTTPNGMVMGAGGNWLQDLYSAGGGTTYGDIFMIDEDDPDDAEERLAEIIESGGTAANTGQDDLDRLLHHEEIHSQQWDRYTRWDYIARYVDASTDWQVGWPPVVERDPCENEYEQEAGLEDGGYNDCADQPYNGPEGEGEPDDGRDEEGDLGYDWYVDDEGMPRCVPHGHALERETHLHMNPADEEDHQLI